MIRLFSIKTIVVLFSLLSVSVISCAQTVKTSLQNNPWAEDQLLQPEKLADMISKKENVKIYNIGVVENIKGAVNIGGASKTENLEKFRKALKGLPKKQAIVIYCGCCPMGKCPNIRPAFKLLTEEKFTNIKLLDLPDNIKIDWIDKGYPIE